MSVIINANFDIETADYEELKQHKLILEEIAKVQKGTDKELGLLERIAEIEEQMDKRAEECM